MSKSKSRLTNLKSHIGIRKDNSSNSYLACITINGKRKSKSFKKLNDAINWRRTFDPNLLEQENKMLFKEAMIRFKNEHISTLATSTKEYYLRKIPKYAILNELRMSKITPSIISSFLESAKDESNTNGSIRRHNFDQEIKILNTFFIWYTEIIDYKFKSPILKRHKQQGKLKEKSIKSKKMTYQELELFLRTLEMTDAYWFDFAMVHFFFAARVQEVAGLQVSSIDFNTQSVIIKDVAIWGNDKKFLELKTMPKNGEVRNIFINSKLKAIFLRRLKNNPSTYVFNNNGKPHEYREIQYRYNKALKRCGLHPKFSGTHFMRHSMATLTRKVTGSLEATQAITGHRDQKMVQHYASIDLDANKNAQLKILDFMQGQESMLCEQKRTNPTLQ